MIASAQVKFAEGYIVNNKNEKTYCLIRNVGQEESTAKYQYKLKNEKEIHDMELSKIAEFGIENEMKCIRELIAVDMASETIKNVNDTVASWVEGHAYIKLLVEGELATLYSNYDHGRPLFFYSYGNSPVEPLVYKKFSVEVAPNVVSQYIYNNTYVQQLEDNLSCGTPVESRKISYSKKDIVNYFIDFHKCKGADYTVYQSSQNKKGSVRFKIGANYNILQAAVEEFRMRFRMRSFQRKIRSESVQSLNTCFHSININGVFLPKPIIINISPTKLITFPMKLNT